ncbi:MAG TPA: DUF29 domain-containing protein [Oculatellaceae cyanobacterium]|jgi:hypothetical protein
MVNQQLSSVTPQHSLYEEDYCLWIEKTANQIRSGNFNLVDWDNLVEELESLGNSDKRELENRLTVLLEHLLKLAYWEPERETNARGWLLTIKEQRRQIKKLLRDSPSLKYYAEKIFIECYQDALEDAAFKSKLDILPSESPFTLEETLNSDYLPTY